MPSQYGRKHDRLQRRGEKLESKGKYQRADKKLSKARNIRAEVTSNFLSNSEALSGYNSSSNSPNKFIGSIAGAAARASRSGGGQVDFNALASRGGLLGAAAKAIQKRRNRAADNVPSVVATAGASNMSGRIEGIESRLAALESGGTTAGATQPAQVAPSETFTDPLTGVEIQRGATGNGMSPEARAEAARARRDERAMVGTTPPPAPASEELGSLMASPFTMRQRSNMGPLNLNSPLNGNAFSKAVQDAKAAGKSTFEVGGKTYKVK